MAVMITVEVVGVGAEPLPPPLPGSPLPLQPETNIRPVQIAASNNASCNPRLLLQPKMKRKAASAVSGGNGPELVRKAEDRALVEIVSWVVATVVPDGVTVAGLNEQAAPLGSPEQAKLIVELKPYSGVTVRVASPWLPEVTVSAVGKTLRVTVGGGAELIVREIGVVSVTP